MASAKRIYRSISSMKTGLVLLVLIALASALGSAFLPDVFFNTVLFKCLLLLLFLNMVLCTINRLNRFKSGFIKGTKSRQWLPRQIGIILLHAGIVFILAGGTIYAYLGQSGEISIATGDTVDISKVITIDKPFSLRLDDFKIKFNKDGSPSQYYSYVTILEDDKIIRQETISVNHPLKYQEIKAYQQSFGYMVKVKPVDNAGHVTEKLLEEGDLLKITGTKRVVKMYRYFPNFDPAGGMGQTSMKPDNPRVVYSVYENDKLLGVGAAKFGDKIEIDNNIYITFTGVEPYTVLEVKSDPGLPLALAGGLMFMIGVSLALLATPVKRKSSMVNQEDIEIENME
ncbi:MAG: cytochrome c biogenesis protein ResB [Syntrophomonas sp.]